MKMTPATSAIADGVASISGPDVRCSFLARHIPHSVTSNAAIMSGHRMASRRRKLSPKAPKPATMNGVPAQHSAAKLAASTPAASALKNDIRRADTERFISRPALRDEGSGAQAPCEERTVFEVSGKIVAAYPVILVSRAAISSGDTRARSYRTMPKLSAKVTTAL